MKVGTHSSWAVYCTYGVGGGRGIAKNRYIQDCWSGECHSSRVDAGWLGVRGIVLLELGYARMDESCGGAASGAPASPQEPLRRFY